MYQCCWSKLLRAKHLLQEGEYIGSTKPCLMVSVKRTKLIDYFRTRSRMFNFSNRLLVTNRCRGNQREIPSEWRTARENCIKFNTLHERKDCHVGLEAHLVIWCITSHEQDKWNAHVNLGDNGKVNSELISPHWNELWFTVRTVTGYLHPSDKYCYI